MPYVPIEWLREHVDVPSGLSAEQLAADLVRVGLERTLMLRHGIAGLEVVGAANNATAGQFAGLLAGARGVVVLLAYVHAAVVNYLAV